MTNPSLKERIIGYYTDTYIQYRTVWSSLYKHAGYWDEQTRGHAHSLERMLEIMAAAVDLGPGMTVLDAGCGVGGTSVWIARHFPDTRVEGITLVPAEVEQASRHARRFGVADRVRFSVQDYTATEFPDGSFDVVWAHESVCHAEDKGAFCREAFRVLKPGGRLVIADGYIREDDLLPAEERLLRRWCDCWAVSHLVRPEVMREALRGAGFVDVRGRDVTPRIKPSSRRLYRLAAATYPLLRLARALRLVRPWQFENHLGGILQYHLFFTRDVMRYWIFTARKPGGDRPPAGGGDG